MTGITIEKARRMCWSMTGTAGTERVAVASASGRVCAETVYADAPQPPFPRARMDGFALRSADSGDGAILRVIGKAPAGVPFCGAVSKGETVRIMTGAPMPEGADAVAPFEEVSDNGETVVLSRKYRAGEAFSEPGMDVRENDALCRAGCVVSPWEASALTCCGIEEVSVFKRPKLGIISTGSELYSGNGEPAYGKIRNSNGTLFASLLSQNGCCTEYFGVVGDDDGKIAELVKRASDSCDAVIVTGGVCGGDYDLTPDAVISAGGTLYIRGIDARPGYGCAYGILGGKPVICLSGSPGGAALNIAAVGFCVIDKMRGIKDANIRKVRAELSDDVRRADCTILVPGYIENTEGKTVFRQIPHGLGRISGKALCSCAGAVAPGEGCENKGTVIDVYKMIL